MGLMAVQLACSSVLPLAGCSSTVGTAYNFEPLTPCIGQTLKFRTVNYPSRGTYTVYVFLMGQLDGEEEGNTGKVLLGTTEPDWFSGQFQFSFELKNKIVSQDGKTIIRLEPGKPFNLEIRVQGQGLISTETKSITPCGSLSNGSS